MAQHAARQSPDHARETGLTTPPPLPPNPSTPKATTPPAPMIAAPVSPATPVSLPSSSAPVPRRPAVRPVPDETACDLCGASLDDHSGHYHMVSPLTARKVAVCRTCRRAALGEGYRPRA